MSRMRVQEIPTQSRRRLTKRLLANSVAQVLSPLLSSNSLVFNQAFDLHRDLQ